MGLIGRKAQKQKAEKPELAKKLQAQQVFSAKVDGHILGVAAFDGVTLALTGEGDLHRFDGGDSAAKVLRFHENGALSFASDRAQSIAVSGGMDGTINIYRVADHSHKVIRLHANAWVESLQVSGNLIAAAAGRNVYLVDTVTDDVRTLGPHTSTVAAISFSGDGAFVAAARNGGVDYWNTKTGEKRELAWKSSIVSVACSPNGEYVAGGCQDDAVHFWRLPTHEDSMMSGYPSKPKHIRFSHDGALLCTSAGLELVVWNFRGRGPEGTAPIVLEGHGDSVQSIAAAPSSATFASGAKDGSVSLWRPSKHKDARVSFALAASVEALAFGATDAVLVAGSSSGELVVTNLSE